ncbi:hypothetical protein HDV04_001860 [Boothiomyces sp. JEL0838]|nr:hypothetical protein HDV04_001860 [Boothiomyces sp. JEL0838]
MHISIGHIERSSVNENTKNASKNTVRGPSNCPIQPENCIRPDESWYQYYNTLYKRSLDIQPSDKIPLEASDTISSQSSQNSQASIFWSDLEALILNKL